MLRFTQIYKGKDHLNNFLEKRNINKDVNYIVRIITSNLQKNEALSVFSEVSEVLPTSTILGSSSAGGVILDGKIVDNETVIIIELYQKSHIIIKNYSWDSLSPYELANAMHKDFSEYATANSVPLVNLVCSDQYPDVNEFVYHTNNFTPLLKLSGGVAGDIISTNLPGYVFTKDGILDKSVVAYCVVGEDVVDFVKISASMESISPEYTITKVNESFIEEIEHEPAVDWLYNYLDIDDERRVSMDAGWDTTVDSDYLAHFPLMIEHSDKSGRFTRFDTQNNKLSLYYSKLPENTKFRVGYVNPSKTTSETYDICEEILDTPVEYMFIYACLFRKLYLSNCITWEMMPFDNYHICGMFMMGEIAFDGTKNQFLNGSSVFVGFAENQTYVIPDISKVESTKLIEDNDSFIKKAKQKGLERIRHGANSLLDKIEQKKTEVISDKFLDPHLSLPNIYKFEQDKEEKNIDKIFAIDVSTADNTIAVVGQEMYYLTCKNILSKISDRLEQRGMELTTAIYILNYKTFIITGIKRVSSDFFLENMKMIFNEFEHEKSMQTGLPTVLRGAVVLHQEKVLETALNLLLATKDSGDSFFVYDKEKEYSSSSSGSHEESQVINLIATAITDNGIVPYYQGLHNNKLGKIDKYEALMRIVDADGNVYTPFVFMDIAKKYKFYNRISQIMIEKVLEDFKDREETVSINVSLQDIQSDIFRTWLVNKLKSYPHPEKVIIEFVETENYQTLNTLFDFVNQVKKLGSGIAIDDFGSGYSNFSTLLSLNPNFIKIDGSIVKELQSSSDNVIILNTIKFLASQIKTVTVAEFVENSEIQEIVENHDVTYSQGYYFAKPLPLNEIDANLNQQQ